MDGTYTELGKLLETMFESNDGIWHHIKVEMVGDNLTVSLDDHLLFDVVDTDLAEGTVALSSWGMSPGVAFDNVQVTPLSSTSVDAHGKLPLTWATLKR